MADLSNYMKGAISDYFFRPGVAAPTRPSSLVMSLWSAVTDADAGTGTELSGNGYARATVTWGAVSLPSGLLASNFTATFPTATADWAAATHYGVHDQLGNLLQSLTALNSPQTVLSGSHAEAAAGALTITLS